MFSQMQNLAKDLGVSLQLGRGNELGNAGRPRRVLTLELPLWATVREG